MSVETVLALTLKAGEEDRLLAGHSWVFSNELKEVPKAEPGTVAVLNLASGKPLGVGFYNPNSLIAFRLLTRKPEPIDAAFLKERLAAALAYRRRVAAGEESFRLAFGESDGLPGLVVDKFADFLSVQILSAGMERLESALIEALREVLNPKGIYFRNDHPTRSLEGLPLECRAAFGEVPETVRIEEGGLKYLVSPGAGQKTGFYFDQRENRAFLKPYFKDRGVLDLHCYTGAFALNAARAGAAQVFGLDSSGPAIALAKENAKLNGLEAEFDEGDAEEVLDAFAGDKQPFKPDFILVDPPSLVSSRKHLPAGLRAYAKLNTAAFRCLPKGGLLATSTCSHHVSREDFVKTLRAAAAKAGKSARILALRGQAADHPVLLAMPETEYLHFALLEIV
ncbi:MAG TPA: class I SAM-dependent rRNA methyltransferase [Elusimicrobiota bacterium]|jgi:23S rRNA (cytosine1962-C5)-methyltransferase|nr:class I SAM-dependent rRNA methyltransferase [Elusimicrobiota bacterium]